MYTRTPPTTVPSRTSFDYGTATWYASFASRGSGRGIPTGKRATRASPTTIWIPASTDRARQVHRRRAYVGPRQLHGRRRIGRQPRPEHGNDRRAPFGRVAGQQSRLVHGPVEGAGLRAGRQDARICRSRTRRPIRGSGSGRSTTTAPTRSGRRMQAVPGPSGCRSA